MTFLRFLKRLICDNPAKMVFLVVGIISFFIVKDIPREKEEYNVITSFENDGIENYVVRGTNSEKSYSVCKLDKDNDELKSVVFSDGTSRTKILSKEITVPCVILWILFGICCVVIIVGIFAGDDGGWDFSGNWFDAVVDGIKIDEEDGLFYYHINGKLLYEADHRLDKYHISDRVQEYMKHPNLFTDYKGSVADRREKKLKKLGVI